MSFTKRFPSCCTIEDAVLDFFVKTVLGKIVAWDSLCVQVLEVLEVDCNVHLLWKRQRWRKSSFASLWTV